VVAAPVVAPVTTSPGVNANAPVSANVLGNQSHPSSPSMPTGGGASQSNASSATTTVAPGSGSSAGVVAAPVVAPVTTGAGVNAIAPLTLNLLGNQSS
jgi:hypothetical protein